MTAYKSPLPTRRSFLNKATCGACTTTVLVSVPELWVKPVVQSIIIPAHAQTSTDDSSTTNTTPCSDSVTIDGGTWDCVSANSFTTTTFGRSNGCIVVSNTEDHSSYIAPASHQLIVGKDPNSLNMFTVHIASSTSDDGQTQHCTNGWDNFYNADVYIEVEGYSYVANYTLTVTAPTSTTPNTSTTISDIVLTPV